MNVGPLTVNFKLQVFTAYANEPVKGASKVGRDPAGLRSPIYSNRSSVTKE